MPEVNPANVGIVFVPVPVATTDTVLCVDPVKAPTLIDVLAFWVTAPVTLPALPTTRDPVAVMLPNATVAAFKTWTAVTVELVVVKVPVFNWIGPPPPDTEIAPDPELTVVAAARVIPEVPEVKVKPPAVEVKPLLTVSEVAPVVAIDRALAPVLTAPPTIRLTLLERYKAPVKVEVASVGTEVFQGTATLVPTGPAVSVKVPTPVKVTSAFAVLLELRVPPVRLNTRLFPAAN